MTSSHSIVRFAIHRLISGILPWDQQERDHIDFALNWINSGVEIFRLAKPDIPNIHLVVYFCVIDQKNKEMLLVDHKNSGLWLPPGGHVEFGEHPKEAVKREAKEELGMDAHFLYEEPLFLTKTETVGNTAGHTDISLWYTLKEKKNTSFSFDRQEFNDAAWFKWDNVPFDRTDPHMQRFVSKIKTKMGVCGILA